MKYLTLIIANFYWLSYCIGQQRIEVSINSSQPTQLEASAGEDVTSSGSELTLGDSPTAAGGLEPYSYQWLPETDLDDATQANPIYSGTEEQTFTLEVIDNRGCTARDTVMVSITGLSDVPEENLLVVYPNPGAGFIKLSMKESKEGLPREIRMFDATGKLIISEQWNSFHEDYLIDVTSLSAGSYIISVGQGKDVITRQFIISK